MVGVISGRFGLVATPIQTDADGRLIVRGEDQLFSFKGTLEILVSGVPSAAGGKLETGAVPDGEIWVVTHLSAYDADTALSWVLAGRVSGGVEYQIGTDKRAFAVGEPAVFSVQAYLKKDDFIRCWYIGSLAADTCVLSVIGCKMTVET